MADASVLTQTPESVVERVSSFVSEGLDLDEGRLVASASPFWRGLKDLGTELWLDTGDIDAASRLWTAEFSALTTNNTLLNAEVQKGIYDDLVTEAAAVVSELDLHTRVIEIAFILNARHGLRLVQRFGGKVSVELHTDLAQDVDATLRYARRYIEICPEHFIVKIPLTPAGLIATRTLRAEGVPINFTLGFSARHNYLATGFARPSFVNVFLGRLGTYVADNQLGDGRWVGEKATLASQRAVTELSKGRPEPTRQIAASLREPMNVKTLAGVDVFTMPIKVAEGAPGAIEGDCASAVEEDYEVSVSDGAGLDQLWDISESVRALTKDLDERPPTTREELVDRAHELGAGDLFPRLSPGDLERLTTDGKIPVHATWAERIAAGELSADTLLNLAGLASFTGDQTKLDDRIRSLLS